jgi:hypothetical protein
LIFHAAIVRPAADGRTAHGILPDLRMSPFQQVIFFLHSIEIRMNLPILTKIMVAMCVDVPRNRLQPGVMEA